MSKITGVFGAVLPAIITVTVLVLVLAGIVSRKLTKAILEPIGWINLDGDSMDIYDELTPYVKKINQQKKEIDAQMEALKYRISTIEVITGSMKEGLLLIDKDRTVLIANQSVSDIFDEKEIAQKNILHVCRDIEFQQGVKQCLSGVVAEILFRRGGRLYNVSHELKTPLTSISALAEMIANGIAKEGDIQAFAEKIKTQTQHLIHIIEDIIRLSEFDEGNANRDYSAFDLKERTASVIDVLREKAAEKNVAITLEGEKISLTANKRMMDELMYNLLDNAIKYNREGGSVSVVLAAENSMCKIIVSDTGIGIPKEQQSRVFERFYRVDASRYKKTGGTGLGLSIVKHIAEHHGGRVELESAEGEGTRVVCWLGGSG
jgi:two-component system phosphate regulon sensor histidine kinase PhoR